MYSEKHGGDVRMEENQGVASQSSSSETEEDEELCKLRAAKKPEGCSVTNVPHLEGCRWAGNRESGEMGGDTGSKLKDAGKKRETPKTSGSGQLKLWQAPRTRNLRVRFSVGRGHGRVAKSLGSTRERIDALQSDKGGKTGAHGAKHLKGGGAQKKHLGAELNKGQSSSTDTDDDGELIQRAIKAKEEMLQRQRGSKGNTPKKKQPKASGVRPGSVNLKVLIDEGILFPGEDVLSLEYRGIRETADLHGDGRIHWKDNTFDSPSAFSIFIKRLVNPTRKADDGWKTVKFSGNYLDHYKCILAKKRAGNDAPSYIASNLADASSGKEPHKRQRIDSIKPAPEADDECSLPLSSPGDVQSRSVSTEVVNYHSLDHINCTSSGVEMLDENEALRSDDAISRRDLGLHSKLLKDPLG